MKAHEVQRDILQAIDNIQETASQVISDVQIAERLGLDVQEVQDHLDLMAEEEYVNLAKTYGPSYRAWFTPRGRMVLREPDYVQRETPAQVINILNVIDSQIQNLAQTGGDTVVNQSADSGLNDDVLRIIDQMVEAVRSSGDIEPSIKRDYELEAQELKTELRKSRLNLSRIREMLSFLGDVDGTLGLVTKLAPYFLALSSYIERLIR